MRCQRALELLEQHFFIFGLFQMKIIDLFRVKNDFFLVVCKRIVQNTGQVDLFLTFGQVFPHTQKVRAPYQLIHGTDAQAGHNLTQILRNKFHKVYDIFRFAVKTFPQLRILRRDARRAGVQVADAHHHAAHRHKRRCRKTKFLRAEQRRDRNVPAGHQLTVRLDAHLMTQAVLNQSLVRL